VLKLRLSNGEILEPTPPHRFYSETRQDWVAAGELRVGECLRTASGQAVTLESVSLKAGEHRVYNLEVEQEHQFYVGESGVLVHNTYQTQAAGRQITPSEYEKLCFGGPGNKQSFDIWAQDSGFTRRPDNWVQASGTIEEASLQRWSEMNLEDPHSVDFQEFNRKLGQAEADGWLLANNPKVNEAIWYGPEPLPTTGRAAELTLKLNQLGIKYKVVPV
jgi:hypothetical protein